MTLPVFLTETPLAGASGTITMGPEVAGHAVRVRRMGAGEELELIDGTGVRLRGTIQEGTSESLTLSVTDVTEEPQQRPRLVLVQALAKNDRDIQAIEAATEVGVDTVIPWAAQRSIADWPAKKAHKMAAKWANVLTAATLQARRARVPELGELIRGTAVTQLVTPTSRVIVLDETESSGLTEAVNDLGEGSTTQGDIDEIVVIVGPEGGITPAEVDALVSEGARTAVLGPTILRASTAGPVALAIVQTLLGRWK
ncbi:16S rRNA (uracil(1498)-N(3))-methyltransferase [Brevibacterium paucivorans]|uniref:Ribosomal RNA small subunit methyltransferase E n=1 Tax=Brevibacterium paucivorans TaxID=170994 RepID=A0A2N6VQW0_9MICO|nr:16S rRNA (uracil(1498)-N(3))-methyltransferase [Brevibacterium paucivorans]PMD06506.1 16S rRNA (uracil(1498)-N(3))-methyltransferase [Brevibacterium paucivorans]